eukprot:5801245-Pyramimonas_sp.AAC.2
MSVYHAPDDGRGVESARVCAVGVAVGTSPVIDPKHLAPHIAATHMSRKGRGYVNVASGRASGLSRSARKSIRRQ